MEAMLDAPGKGKEAAVSRHGIRDPGTGQEIHMEGAEGRHDHGDCYPLGTSLANNYCHGSGSDVVGLYYPGKPEDVKVSPVNDHIEADHYKCSEDRCPWNVPLRVGYLTTKRSQGLKAVVSRHRGNESRQK